MFLRFLTVFEMTRYPPLEGVGGGIVPSEARNLILKTLWNN